MRINFKFRILLFTLCMLLCGMKIQAWVSPINTEIPEDEGYDAVVGWTRGWLENDQNKNWFKMTFAISGDFYSFFYRGKYDPEKDVSTGQIIRIVPFSSKDEMWALFHLWRIDPLHYHPWYMEVNPKMIKEDSFSWIIFDPESPDSPVGLIYKGGYRKRSST